jgi:hypothetical protein
LKRFWRTLTETLGSVGVTEKRLLTAAALLVFTLQLGSFLFYAAQVSDSRPVIAGLDNDGSNAIDVAGRSTWVTDNGFAGYGPVYFRVANTLASIMPDMSAPGELSPAEAHTKTLDFALLVTSVLACVLTSLVLMGILVREWWLRLLLAAILTRLITVTDPWMVFLLRPHPDWFLTLTVVLATIASVRYWQEPANEHRFRLSAWAWGLALATKLSIVLFMPFVFVPVFILARIRACLRYFGHIILAYMLLGFPQNLNLPRTLRFLRHQATYSERATSDSIIEWFHLWLRPLALPLLLVIALLLFVRLRSRVALCNWKIGLFSLGLGIGPFLLLLPQHVLADHEHYTIPNVASQLALMLLLLQAELPPLGRRQHWLVMAIVCAGLMWAKLVPSNLNGITNKMLSCRPEARAVYQQVRTYVNDGRKIYLDPYVPSADHTPNAVSSWTTNKSLIASGGFDVLVLKGGYYWQYLDDLHARYYSSYNPEYLATREFYSLFKDHEAVQDPVIGNWHRVSLDGCTWEVWERVKQ